MQGFRRPGRITDRESDYQQRRLNRFISPARNDAFAMGDRTPANDVRTYGDVLREQQLAREKENTLRWAACRAFRQTARESVPKQRQLWL